MKSASEYSGTVDIPACGAGVSAVLAAMCMRYRIPSTTISTGCSLCCTRTSSRLRRSCCSMMTWYACCCCCCCCCMVYMCCSFVLFDDGMIRRCCCLVVLFDDDTVHQGWNRELIELHVCSGQRRASSPRRFDWSECGSCHWCDLGDMGLRHQHGCRGGICEWRVRLVI